ncbi:hypothetical protein A1D22_10815 [Pasteurellaceae bacterium LFhippo2]|nr:hypothetical protein [Pasteurellaceae bacterium LFhippo2]
MIVLLAPEFETGFLNEEYFKDLPYFNDQEIEIFLDFITNVEQNLPLKGKNKTSWQNNYGSEIPDTEWYKEHNCWHYHCGEYIGQEPKVYTIQLSWNIEGLTSSAVIHYQKLNREMIYILAYSPKHIPFPRVDIASNPIISRV